jgi:GntR family transcriptional regulator, transcriptional repressor for pyruvate dehydrogenase complex
VAKVELSNLKVKLKDQQTLVEKILLHFKNALISRELKPGDRVPTESSLVESFGVSRTAVREAFKMLAAIGLVESRQGAGTFIAKNVTPLVIDPLVFSLIIGGETPHELLDVRKMIEVGILEVLFDKATKEDLEEAARANAALEEYEKNGTDLDQLARLDLEFHYALAEATHNPTIAKIAHTIWDLFSASIRKSSLHEKASFYHQRILQAIMEGDREKAREAIRVSLEVWEKHRE